MGSAAHLYFGEPIGYRGGTPFVVQAGTDNFNAISHTTETISQTITTTNAFLTSSVYQFTAGPVSAVPEPDSMAMLGAGMGALVVLRRKTAI